MKTQDRIYMNEQILRHGENLNRIFNTGIDPGKLCKKLHTLENQAHRLTTEECNTGNDYEVQLSAILTRVKKLLFPDTFKSDPELFKAVYINGDARGYALKIKESYTRVHQLQIHSDMGGYGILAPDFTPNN